MLPNRALSNFDLLEFGKRYLKYFRGVFMRDTLPRSEPWKYECGIINLDNQIGSGTHWVAYYKNFNTIKYFDSFGDLRPPKEVLSYLGNNITYNYDTCQKINTFNCGHLCLNFLLNSNYNKNIIKK